MKAAHGFRPRRRAAERRTSRRCGVAVVLVLGLLGVTAAVYYAMMRTQVVTLHIHDNFARRGEARQAALAGMAAAMRRLHDPDWAEAGGVNLQLQGTLAEGVTYAAHYVTGDESLSPSDPDYPEYPYRLTIYSTGSAVDPNEPARRTEYQVHSVVQLVRRAMYPAPPAWFAMQDDTLTQWADEKSVVEYPVRIEGPVKFGGAVELSRWDLLSSLGFTRYLSDLEVMRQNGLGDHRPLSGPVRLPRNRMRSGTLSLLTSGMNVSVIDAPRGGSAPLSHPGLPTRYRLYPGGREYTVPDIQSLYFAHVTLQSDPRDNPLGVFRSDRPVVLHDGAKLRGAVITAGRWLFWASDVSITGRNVVLEAPDLPPLHGSPTGERVQLPVAIVNSSFRASSGAKATVSGHVLAWDTFQIEAENNGFEMTGRVACKKVELQGWTGLSDWSNLLVNFLLNLTKSDPIPYLPQYLQAKKGMKYDPKPTIRPPTNVRYHWHDWNQPLFIPHPDDEGLVWDLVRWRERQG